MDFTICNAGTTREVGLDVNNPPGGFWVDECFLKVSDYDKGYLKKAGG